MKEQRRHRRFFVSEGALAVAQDHHTAQILDISEGGMSLWFFNKASVPKWLSYDIHLDEVSLNAKHIPVNLVWQRKPNFIVSSEVRALKVGVQFGRLPANQKAQIKKIIMHYSDSFMA